MANKFYATGKRKTAIAKVWLSPGSGKMTINGQSLDSWLGGHEAIKLRVMQPLQLTKQVESVDIKAVTFGGGYSAQADALRHGISKALTLFEENFRKILKPHGLLTRDARVVERKKYGKRKARRSPQFSKR
jgi:small subunit ribosomal protein S9